MLDEMLDSSARAVLGVLRWPVHAPGTPRATGAAAHDAPDLSARIREGRPGVGP